MIQAELTSSELDGREEQEEECGLWKGPIIWSTVYLTFLLLSGVYQNVKVFNDINLKIITGCGTYMSPFGAF